MASSKLKVATILGTRPEIIRLSRVIARLNESVDHKLIHTGQNYDHELNEIFFSELRIPKPDHFLEVDAGSLGATLGGILSSVEKVFQKERPDAALILGDTNSSIAGIMARRMKIPLYHMEAGNRCFDPNVPEEINRKIIDHIADFNLVYTEHARRHLLSEGLPHRYIYLTGSPMKEVLDHFASDIERSAVLDSLDLERGKYILASIHREENVDSNQNLLQALEAFNRACDVYDMPVVVSTHPRTRSRLENLPQKVVDPRVQFPKPFGYFDYNKLQKNAYCVLSDSGTITEESSLLGFPAVTIRNAMERPEGLDTGSILISGLDPAAILQCIDQAVRPYAEGSPPPTPADYLVDNVSQRVVNLITGTARLCHRWKNVELHDYN